MTLRYLLWEDVDGRASFGRPESVWRRIFGAWCDISTTRWFPMYGETDRRRCELQRLS
jgi:hypothetical protein